MTLSRPCREKCIKIEAFESHLRRSGLTAILAKKKPNGSEKVQTEEASQFQIS
jgi:hypothetical protein